MKTHSFLPGLLALLAAAPAFAVTDTRDGNSPNAGAGDSNISSGLNWADDTAPLTNLATADLIFGGTTKLTPNFSAFFRANSVTFNNTSGAFSLGGQTLTIGAGGITNNDADPQTIGNSMAIGTATSSLNATGGALTFTNAVNTGANTLNITGGTTAPAAPPRSTSGSPAAPAPSLWNPARTSPPDVSS